MDDHKKRIPGVIPTSNGRMISLKYFGVIINAWLSFTTGIFIQRMNNGEP